MRRFTPSFMGDFMGNGISGEGQACNVSTYWNGSENVEVPFVLDGANMVPATGATRLENDFLVGSIIETSINNAFVIKVEGKINTPPQAGQVFYLFDLKHTVYDSGIRCNVQSNGLIFAQIRDNLGVEIAKIQFSDFAWDFGNDEEITLTYDPIGLTFVISGNLGSTATTFPIVPASCDVNMIDLFHRDELFKNIIEATSFEVDNSDSSGSWKGDYWSFVSRLWTATDPIGGTFVGQTNATSLAFTNLTPFAAMYPYIGASGSYLKSDNSCGGNKLVINELTGIAVYNELTGKFVINEA